MEATHHDVLIIGAGLSGISAAYHLQTRCPTKTYAILEGREAMGGTWDLFRYPGIRSDSDMYTLGYSFKPWTNPKAIADGASILEYIRETASENGIDRHIRYGHRVERASWSSKSARWTLDVRVAGELRRLSCNFVFSCSGYYDYDHPYTPDFPGVADFRGEVVHPQKWKDDVAYEGKRVVVIGSGATAVTLVPELAKKAAHVTMLQRSPTYIVSAPERDPLADALRDRVSAETAYSITRWKNVLVSMGLYNFCRTFPDRARSVLLAMVDRQLEGSRTGVEHFTPSYAPWDQRLCLVPNSDLFRTLRSGRASVVTDHIERFTEKGILLKSGEELEADLVVTATGLTLKFLGGVELEVDGEVVVPREKLTYKGMMCTDVPNMALAIGYTNASWTLKCDLTSEYVCRLLQHMDATGTDTCVPRWNREDVEAEPLITLASGYFQRSLHLFPQQGSAAPFRLYMNYALDRLALRHAPVTDSSMEFRRNASARRDAVVAEVRP